MRRQPGVGGEQVAVALGLRHRVPEALPFLGAELRHAPVEPVDLGAAGGGHGDDHHLAHPLRVPLGVGHRERRTPGGAVDQPALDAEVLAQALDVLDQVPGGVQAQVHGRVGGVRGAAPAVALVEADQPVAGRVPGPHGAAGRAGARSAVQMDGGLARRIAQLFVVEAVAVPGVEEASVVGLGRSVEVHHGGRSYADPAAGSGPA